MVQGEGNVLRINLFHLSGLSLYTVSVIVLFVLHPLGSAVRMLGLFTLCMCIGLFVGLLVLRQATGRRGDVAERDHLRSFARRGYLSGVGLLDGLGLDLLVVAILLGESALGLYQVAVSATNIAIVVFGPLSQMLLARLAGAADDPVGAAGLLRRWVLASVALDLLIVGGLEVVVGPVMRFAFGPRFYSIVPCARILIVGWALLGLRRVLIAVTQSQGNAGRASRIEVASLGLMLVLGAALARAVGTTGVAFAVAAAGASSCVALAVGVRWRPVR
jgi:O-antigen/teichoic acid export membrane protein